MHRRARAEPRTPETCLADLPAGDERRGAQREAQSARCRERLCQLELLIGERLCLVMVPDQEIGERSLQIARAGSSGT